MLAEEVVEWFRCEEEARIEQTLRYHVVGEVVCEFAGAVVGEFAGAAVVSEAVVTVVGDAM
jgi:hypothetical protein